MTLMAEALLEAKDDPEQVEYFASTLLGESHRMGAMITELITVRGLGYKFEA